MNQINNTMYRNFGVILGVIQVGSPHAIYCLRQYLGSDEAQKLFTPGQKRKIEKEFNKRVRKATT